MKKNHTVGLVVGNRGFFPDKLAEDGRQSILRVLDAAGVGVVTVTPEMTKYGAVETRSEARLCAELFRKNQESIDGIIVSLPNFGDERAVAETIRMSGLRVPVLVQATPDEVSKMDRSGRRDSFCGKMSVCNNLRQYGIPFSLTKTHTVSPDSPEFKDDLSHFLGICRVTNGLRGLRVGAIGARPAAFNTVRYSEKLLEASGISVETVDLSDIFGRAGRLADDSPAVAERLSAIRGYAESGTIPEAKLIRMAKLAAVIGEWMKEAEVEVTAVQCWTAMEEFYGIVPCTVMSMMNDALMPSACETDVCGAISMYALQMASGTPSALLDWNNNYGSAAEKAVCFHCSSIAKSLLDRPRLDTHAILAETVGEENTHGTVNARMRPGPVTYARFSTDEFSGKISGYVGEGELTDDELTTFGGYGVVHIPNLEQLLRFICERGFEHHVAMNGSKVGSIVEEATTRYLGWDVHRHT